ncbi:PAS domain-containing protein [Spirosoma gilvum]
MTTSLLLPTDQLLQALIQDSQLGLILYRIIRDSTGHPLAFCYQLVNSVAASLLGATPQELVGKNCQEVFPQGDDLRAYYNQVAMDGQNLRIDYQLPQDGRWFQVHITSQGYDTLLCFFTDITERVEAEQALIKNLTLLQETEALAAIGSWDYDRSTGSFFWSTGMYQLFGLELGSPVSTQTYLSRATAADQASAQRLVELMLGSMEPFEQELSIDRHGQEVRILIKGVVRADGEGAFSWVLGIGKDTSASDQ